MKKNVTDILDIHTHKQEIDTQGKSIINYPLLADPPLYMPLAEVSHIDEAEVLEKYKNEVRSKAAETMTAEDMEYIEEDLRSPCTQEIAVFKAFAEIVDKAENEIVVIDTAPTGHTLLLLDATQSYHKEVERTQGEVTGAVANLLPRLRNPQETEVVIVT